MKKKRKSEMDFPDGFKEGLLRLCIAVEFLPCQNLHESFLTCINKSVRRKLLLIEQKLKMLLISRMRLKAC